MNSPSSRNDEVAEYMQKVLWLHDQRGIEIPKFLQGKQITWCQFKVNYEMIAHNWDCYFQAMM